MPATLLPNYSGSCTRKTSLAISPASSRPRSANRQDRRHRRHEPGARRRPLHPGLTSSARSRSTPTSRSSPLRRPTPDFGDRVQRSRCGQDLHQNIPRPTGTDVLFQVAGETGNGVLEAACAAGIHRHRRRRRPVAVAERRHEPDLRVHRHLGREAPLRPRFSAQINRSPTARCKRPATSCSTPPTTASATRRTTAIPPDHARAIQALVDAALEACRTARLVTCPETCGSRPSSAEQRHSNAKSGVAT